MVSVMIGVDWPPYRGGCFFGSLSERIKITPKYDTIVKVWQPHY